MTPHEHAGKLLEEWLLCQRAKPKKNAVDIQLDKDTMSPWATYLIRQLSWGTDNDIVEACYQFESRLSKLKEKLVIEVLTNGTI